MKKQMMFAISISLSLLSGASFAAAACIDSTTLPDQTIYFYTHKLGIYTVDLQPTLSAIENNQAGPGIPYVQKPWLGNCPYKLSNSNTCTEYTIYPNDTNFSPSGIMGKIKRHWHGKPNRGEVRVLVNASQTQYDYTIDHETTFCGPYPMS
jgi:hypothetical protein